MIVYLAHKEKFREDILSNRIEEIVLESFQAKLGKSVGASERLLVFHSDEFRIEISQLQRA
jgi:hypothetical protein